MSDVKLDIFDDHYRVLRTDPEARRTLIDNPAKGMIDHFGTTPGNGDYALHVIPEDDDTIVMVLPALPESGEAAGPDQATAGGRVYDLLFESGIGGFLIPSEQLTWVLRDFRSAVSKPDGD